MLRIPYISYFNILLYFKNDTELEQLISLNLFSINVIQKGLEM